MWGVGGGGEYLMMLPPLYIPPPLPSPEKLKCNLSIHLFSASKSNGHVINVTDNSVSTSTRSPGSDTSNAADTRLCCCSLDVRKYEVDECFTFQCNCCTCLKLTTCHVIWLCIRYNVKQLVEHKLFEWFIVFLIAASSIALVSQNCNNKVYAYFFLVVIERFSVECRK